MPCPSVREHCAVLLGYPMLCAGSCAVLPWCWQPPGPAVCQEEIPSTPSLVPAVEVAGHVVGAAEEVSCRFRALMMRYVCLALGKLGR